MIRLFIFVMIRFFLISLAIYVALTLLKKFIQSFRPPSRQSTKPRYQEPPPKPKEEYKDVKDAKFVELNKNQNEKEPPPQS